MVDVVADPDWVRARLEGRLVADHARVWARGATVTDPRTSRVLRCCGSSSEPRTTGTVAPDDSLVRDLADYHRAFGLDGFDVTSLSCDEDVA